MDLSKKSNIAFMLGLISFVGFALTSIPSQSNYLRMETSNVSNFNPTVIVEPSPYNTDIQISLGNLEMEEKTAKISFLHSRGHEYSNYKALKVEDFEETADCRIKMVDRGIIELNGSHCQNKFILLRIERGVRNNIPPRGFLGVNIGPSSEGSIEQITIIPDKNFYSCLSSKCVYSNGINTDYEIYQYSTRYPDDFGEERIVRGTIVQGNGSNHINTFMTYQRGIWLNTIRNFFLIFASIFLGVGIERKLGLVRETDDRKK